MSHRAGRKLFLCVRGVPAVHFIVRRLAGTMDIAETAARAVIEAAIPGARMKYRSSQSRGEHDFDLIYPNGEIGAVEATISLNQRRTEAEAALRKQGYFVERVETQHDWLVFLGSTAHVKDVRAQIDHYLAAIERAGLNRFHAGLDSDDQASVASINADLGVEAGGLVPWKEPGIGLTGGAYGGAVGPTHATDAVHRELQKDDNRRKLAATGLPQRHLLVYVDSSSTLAWIAVRDLEPPSEPPTLPAEITDVWAVTSVGQRDGYVVWHGDSQKWEHLGILGAEPHKPAA
jgi:hypothetical protein